MALEQNVIYSDYENYRANMSKTETVTGKVSHHVKKQLEAIARERGATADDELVGEAVEHYVTEYEFWTREIERRRDVPREQRRYVSREEGRSWIDSLGTNKPPPQGRTRS